MYILSKDTHVSLSCVVNGTYSRNRPLDHTNARDIIIEETRKVGWSRGIWDLYTFNEFVCKPKTSPINSILI